MNAVALSLSAADLAAALDEARTRWVGPLSNVTAVHAERGGGIRLDAVELSPAAVEQLIHFVQRFAQTRGAPSPLPITVVRAREHARILRSIQQWVKREESWVARPS